MPKKGVVIPKGAAGEADSEQVLYPNVFYKDGYFWMYYLAHNNINIRISLALSKDGINYTKKGVVLPLGAAGEADEYETYACSVLYKDGYFWMYYGAGYALKNQRICLALSKDGINYTKKGVVIPMGAAGEADDTEMYCCSVLYKDGFFWLYYVGSRLDYGRCCLALSKDGINYTKKGVVLPLGAAGEADDRNVYTISVFYKDGYFWMYYCGHDGANIRICLALSKDGINFTKKGVVLPLGAAGEADDVHTNTAHVLYKDGFFWLYYGAHDGGNFRISLALSKDGINFTS